MKKLLLLAAVLLLYGCPDENDCDDFGRIARVPNLIKWTPVQSIYNQGDIVTLKLEIPASNNYYGETINIFEQTNDTNALLIMSTSGFQNGNTLNFLKGTQESEVNWFGAMYNELTGVYELEIEITLNRIGTYDLDNAHNIDFLGRNCNRYFIDTNVDFIQGQHFQFEVIP